MNIEYLVPYCFLTYSGTSMEICTNAPDMQGLAHILALSPEFKKAH